MLIYKIQNKVNNKIYIGQTTRSLEERMRRHCSKSNENTMAISRAIQKYGIDNFDVKILDFCETLEKLNEMEIFYIKKYNSLSPNGYNLTTGGKNFRLSEETKQKISSKLKGKKKSDEHIKKTKESLIAARKDPNKFKTNKNIGRTMDSSRRASLSEAKLNKSNYVGVIIDGKYYRVEFYFNGKRYSYTFNLEHEAGHAYDLLCVEHGLEAVNFPDDIWDRKKIEELRRKKKRESKFYAVKKTKNGKWQAMPWINGRKIYIGRFDSELEAAMAVDEELIKNNLPKRNFDF